MRFWDEKGSAGFQVCKFFLQRDDPSPAPWTKEGKEVARKYYEAGKAKLEALEPSNKKAKRPLDEEDKPKKQVTPKKKKVEKEDQKEVKKKSAQKKRSVEVIDLDNESSPPKKQKTASPSKATSPVKKTTPKKKADTKPSPNSPGTISEFVKRWFNNGKVAPMELEEKKEEEKEEIESESEDEVQLEEQKSEKDQRPEDEKREFEIEGQKEEFEDMEETQELDEETPKKSEAVELDRDGYSSDEYDVEKILEEKKEGRKSLFLIKWVGYEETTWEPVDLSV